MPRRGRHRTRLPLRLLAAVAALLVGGTAVVLGGTALAKGSGGGSIISSLAGKSSSDGSSDSGKSGGKDNDGKDGNGKGKDDGKDDNGSGKDDNGKNGDSSDGKNGDGKDSSGSKDASDGAKKVKEGKDGDDTPDEAKKTDDQQKKDAKNKAAGKKDDPFPGRDKISAASGDDYVDIANVAPNGNRGEGGEFTGGSYSVNCGVSDHNNSDNYMAAPGKRNGAQHVHDYVGNTSTNANSTDDSLAAADTTCANGDKSTFFWPVLRNLNGQGPDVGQDGGSLDGNVGSILKPISADLTFHGHGSEPVKALPPHLMIITGNAKAKAQDGKNANAKYTCTGFENRVTDKYPVCPSGSHLERILDYPSCWDGQNLESKDQRSHMAFPDEQGNCEDGFVPIPALRITLKYDQPAGKAFSIDSFPDNQHDPSTDHSDFESFSTPGQAKAGANCIRNSQRCTNVGG
ncbi:MAG: hypothetical protein QOE59_3021 [Actinomycetota bacterium]|jgi:hypothetical protein|nr:hypothetical protein [Actinomycetota bacterium]